MTQHTTIKDAFGPGTSVDTTAVDVPTDARRLLGYLVSITPNIGVSPGELDLVDFVGDDLLIIPGPLKSQAYLAALQALWAILVRQISALRGVDTDASGLYPATVALGSVNGQTFDKLDNLTSVGINVDRKCIDETYLTYRSWSIYPTKDPQV